jgi:hypothetical protein
MRIKNLPIFLFILITLGFAQGCYPEGAETNSDYDLIISAYNPGFDFSSASSFALPDTLIVLNDTTASELIELTPDQRVAFVAAVRENLVSYGWNDSTNAQAEAETIVLVSAIVAKYSDNIWDEWKWYEGLGNLQPFGQNSRYPWYPNEFPYIYDYTIGTLLITMIDARQLPVSGEEPPTVWIGSLNGIISSKTINTSNVVSTIHRLFELSENLH